MARSLPFSSERGFTLIELMVASIILAVGVLGTVSIIDNSNATTSKTKAREGATNLGRAVMEISKAVPYKDLAPAGIEAELQSHAGYEDASTAAGYQISSRNFVYTITIGVCALDDTKDRLGDHDASVAFCADSDVAAASSTLKDGNPDDYRRVSVGMTYKAPTVVTTSAKQTGIITNPVGGLGPAVNRLMIEQPGTSTTINTPAATASFRAITSVSAAQVEWKLDGAPKGSASGSGSGVSWTFDWNLAETRADGSLRYPDCTYVVQAAAFDDKRRSGAPKALTVKLNRIRPVAPTGVKGGRNLNGSRVDVQWNPNRECDVTGYRVYRGTSPLASNINVLVPGCSTPAGGTACVDETAPLPVAGVTLYYQVVATDLDGSLVTQEGSRSSPALAITEGDSPPTTPTNLQACLGGNPACTDIDGVQTGPGSIALSWDPSTDPNAGDGIDFYRVYRNGSTYGQRYDVLFPVAGKPLVFVDKQPASGSNTYRITAVDTHFGESAPTGPVTITP
jgi:prepilin-type N-terminal cleavage/methylation domain-containing protein